VGSKSSAEENEKDFKGIASTLRKTPTPALWRQLENPTRFFIRIM